MASAIVCTAARPWNETSRDTAKALFCFSAATTAGKRHEWPRQRTVRVPSVRTRNS